MNPTKTLLAIRMIIVSLLFSGIQVDALAFTNNELCTITASSRIYLKGSLSTPTKRSISQVIEVFQEENSLMIYYLNELEKIEITISDENNYIVYSETVSVSEGAKSFIDLNGLKKGNYTIKLNDLKGGELTGIFTIK